MKAWFSFALLAVCAVGTYAQTYDILPGVENIGLGWLPQEDRFGRPVLDLSYNQRLWIRSPYDSKQWSVPDIIGRGGIRTSQAFYKYENEIYNSTKEYINGKGDAMSVGFQAPGLFEFSMTNINKRMNAFLNNTYHKYAVTGEKHLYWSIKAPPPEIASFYLSAELKTMVKRTRGVFNEANKQTWFNIFEYYGTHYPATIELGGEVHMETQIDSKRLRTEDITYTKRGLTIKLGSLATPNSGAPSTPTAAEDPAAQNMVPNNLEIPTNTNPTDPSGGSGDEGEGEGQRRFVQANMEVKINAQDAPAPPADGPAAVPGIPWGLSFSIVRETYRKMLDDLFVESTKESIELIGGHQNNMRPDQWRDWVPTIIEIPESLDKKLRPIHELLYLHPDIPNNEKIVDVWNQALAAYRKWWIEEGRQQAESGGGSWKKRTLRSPLDL